MINEKLISLCGMVAKDVENNQYMRARVASLGIFALETLTIIQEAVKFSFKSLAMLFQALPLTLRACVRVLSHHPKKWEQLDDYILVTPNSLAKSGLKALYFIPLTLSTLFFGIFISPKINMALHAHPVLTPSHRNDFVKDVLNQSGESATNADPVQI